MKKTMIAIGTFAMLWMYQLVGAGEPRLVRDIKTEPASSDPNFLTVLGNRVFFSAEDSEHGHELWVSDGTEASTSLVKDIYQGTRGSQPVWGTPIGDRFFFSAEDAEHGRELWVSDGTAEGTVLVKDIFPGSGSSSPTALAALGNRLFFGARSQRNYRALWVSDGTESGTVLVRDIELNPGEEGATQLTAVGGRLFFRAEDAEHGGELWVSDGTPEGTVLLRDIHPGRTASSPNRLTAVRDRLMFEASDPEHGTELWTSDGTPDGTRLVKDIRAGPSGSMPAALTAVGDRLFFIVDSVSSGRQIWVSDSTAEGTVLLKDFGFAYFSLNAFGGRLFFLAQEDPEYRCELWVSDGTPEGTLLFADLSPGAGSPSPLWLTVVRDRLFIGACRSFWVSDGTPEGTAGLSSCPECGLSSCPECFSEPTAVDERLLFAAWDPEHGRELWVSDGTLEGRALVKDIHRGTIDSGAFELTPLGDRLFFILPGQQLWVSDGTQDGTVFLKDNDLPPRLSAYFPLGELTPLENRLFLRIGFQLWATDGTPEGTVLVKDVEGLGGKLAEGQGAGCSRNCPPSGLEEITAVGDRLFFCATYASSSGELWVSDGTPEGTVFLVEFRGQFYNRVYSLTGAGNRLFFVAASPDLHYTELWSSDGTGEGTVLVQEIYPGTQGTRVQQLTAVDNRVFIQVWHPDHGVELWVSDGSPEGTMLLKEDVGTELLDADLTAVADRLFFHPTDDRGHELWTSDGTPEGTVLVKDILPGTVAPSVFDALSHLTAVGDRLFFRAVDPEHGRELWVSDGTAEGTVLVEDIFPGARSSGVGAFDPIQGGLLDESPALSAIADRLFFRAADPEHGDELWMSDGTSAGTVLLADILPGTGGSAPGHFALVGGQVFFTAQDSEHGRELWVMQLDGMARPFHRGDPNASGTTDISDGLAIFGYLFLGSDSPTCLESADVNNDATIDLSDGIAVLNWLFLGGPSPVEPGPPPVPCGPDVDHDNLGCETYPPCA